MSELWMKRLWRALTWVTFVAGLAVGMAGCGTSKPRAFTVRGSSAAVQHGLRVAIVAETGSPVPASARVAAVSVPRTPTASFSIHLSGSGRVPPGFAPMVKGSSAKMQLRFVPVHDKPYGLACWRISAVHSPDAIIGGGISQGLAEGELMNLLPESGRFGLTGCTQVYALTLAEIATHPGMYVMTLGSRQHPQGVMRGTL